jgi:hypothetical protein
MITNADPGRIIYLSVGLKDGSMEAFGEVKDAVAHATDLVKDEDTERAIFVAVARARVRMAVRVDPIAPPPVPLQPAEPSAPAHAWEESQGLMHEQAAD